jgi:hypothetical protein
MVTLEDTTIDNGLATRWIDALDLAMNAVFTTATFIGYLLSGSLGALVATAGIFLPAVVFVALSGPLVPRLRASPVAGAFLDGANVASLALMAVVTSSASIFVPPRRRTTARSWSRCARRASRTALLATRRSTCILMTSRSPGPDAQNVNPLSDLQR